MVHVPFVSDEHRPSERLPAPGNPALPLLSVILVIFLTASLVQPAEAEYTLRLVNVSRTDLKTNLLTIELDQLPEQFRTDKLQVFASGGKQLPAQIDDLDGDGTPDEMIVEVRIPGGQTEYLNIKKGTPYTAESSLDVTENSIRNELIELHEGRSDLGGAFGPVIDRSSGKPFLKGAVAISDNFDGRHAETNVRVITNGPIRAITEYTGTVEAGGHPYRIRKRNILYRNRRGFDLQWVFENLGNEAAHPPRMHLKGSNAGGVRPQEKYDRDGTLLMPVEKNSWDFLTPPCCGKTGERLKKLIISKNTGYGMGVISNTVKGFDGMNFMNSGSKAGKLLVGGSFSEYGKSTLHTDARTWKIEPGQSEGLTLSFRFYKGPRKSIKNRFLEDAVAAGGVVNVISEHNDLLEIASHPQHLVEEFETTDRWLTDRPVKTTTEDETVTIRTDQSGHGIYTPFTRNFVESTELRAGVNGLSPGTAVKATLVDLRTGTEYDLATWDEPGDYRKDIVRTVQDWYYHLAWHEKKTQWRFKKRKYGNHRYSGEGQDPEPYYAVPLGGVRKLLLKLQLVSTNGERSSTDGPLRATLDRVAFESWMSPPPMAASPYDGVTVSDVALTFYLLAPEGEWNVSEYEIQLSKNRQFDPVRKTYSHLVRNTGKMWTKKASNFYESFTPGELPDPGKYYWRARSLTRAGVPGEWSETRSLTIEHTDQETEELRWEISPRNPRFIVRGAIGEPLLHMDQQVRDHLLRHFGITPVPTSEKLDALMNEAKNTPLDKLYQSPDNRKRSDLQKRLGGWQSVPPKLVKFHKQADLAMMEYLFRNHPDYAMGVTFGEKGIQEPHFQRALKLASRYGRFATQLGGQYHGTSGRAGGDYEAVKQRSEYFLPIIKTNNPNAPFAKALCAMGSYMAGRCHGWGAETEWGSAYKSLGYRWERAYKPQVKTRPLDWMSSLIMGLAGGATVYRIETARGKSTSIWNENERELGDLWTRALGPFIKDLLNENLIPTRSELHESVKVAIDSKLEYGESRFKAGGSFPFHVVGKLNGIDVDGKPPGDVFNTQWIPDRAPFGIVPVLPLDRSREEYNNFQKVVDAERFETPEEAVTYFEQFYPEDESEAWTHLIGDTGLVINSFDWRREAKPQYYKLNLTKGPVETVEGTVSYREYLLMKQRENELFMHTNDYAVRYTKLTLHSRDGNRLKINVRPASALTKANWNNGKLHVMLNHVEGVSRLTVTSTSGN